MNSAEVCLTADHQCLRNSILNLVRMVPASEEVVTQIDEILCDCIRTVETST